MRLFKKIQIWSASVVSASITPQMSIPQVVLRKCGGAKKNYLGCFRQIRKLKNQRKIGGIELQTRISIFGEQNFDSK